MPHSILIAKLCFADGNWFPIGESMKLSALTLSLLALAGSAAFATDLGNQKAGATILDVIRIDPDGNNKGGTGTDVNSNNLYFGRFVQGTNATFVLLPAGSYAGTVNSGYKGGAYTPAYQIKSSPNSDIKISFTSDPVVKKAGVTGTPAANQQMTIKDFTQDLSKLGKGAPHKTLPNVYTVGADGLLGINVGATLVMTGNEESGEYQGTYTLTAVYN